MGSILALELLPIMTARCEKDTMTRLLLVALLAIAGSYVAAEGSKTYPSRIVRIIAGSPGGDADFVARLLALNLSQTLGQQFFVENNGAAGGTVGTSQCARAAPDGYTLCVGHVGTHASAPSLNKDLPYQPLRDFVPVSQVSSAPIVLVTHPSVATSNLQELISLARADPGKLTFSSAGVGTASHLTGEMLVAHLGLKLLHVPYKGAGPALTSVLAGETNVSFLSLPTAIGHIRKGKLRAIAIFSRQRSPVALEVPTAIEQGYPKLESTAWFGLFTPARTDGAITAKLNEAVVTMLGDAGARKALLARGSEPSPTTREEFADMVRREIDKWTEVVTNAGVRAH